MQKIKVQMVGSIRRQMKTANIYPADKGACPNDTVHGVKLHIECICESSSSEIIALI